MTEEEKLEIYTYARTLTGRCRRLDDGRIRWRWGCSWKGKNYHVTALYPNVSPEDANPNWVFQGAPEHVEIHEMGPRCAEGLCLAGAR